MENNATQYLVLDIGTSGIKALVFDYKMQVIAREYKEIEIFYPKEGFVEQSPKELVDTSIEVLQKVVEHKDVDIDAIYGMGITNQRETVIVWDAKTKKEVYPAIVWQDSRTEKQCEELKEVYEESVRKTTGLPIIPYFSATKISWILNNVPRLKKRMERNRIICGTVDTWVLSKITSGKYAHSTDYTNACRTLLFNIKTLHWDDKLCKIFKVPQLMLPTVGPTQKDYGTLNKKICGKKIPIYVLCGDQQSSMYSVGIDKGSTKVTYGTGAFVWQSIGEEFHLYDDFFTTLIPNGKKAYYGIEAKVSDCGKRVEKVLDDEEKLHKVLDEIVSEVDSYIQKLPIKPEFIIADGGVTRNDYLLKKQAEISGIPVKRQETFDGTALGVAMLLQDYENTDKTTF